MGNTPLGKLIVEMGLDDTNFSKGVTGARKQLTALKSDLKTSQGVASAFGGGMSGVAKPTDVLTKMIQTQRKELGYLNESYKNSFNNGKATGNTTRYATEISRANANLALYTGQLKEAATAQYAQTSVLPKISSGLGTASTAFGKLSRAVMPASIAMTATFYKGIQDATEFNGQMSTIQALLRDTAPAKQLGQQMDTLGEKSKSWARQYGVSTESINTGIEEMVKKGYNFNQTLGAMPAVLDASKASGEDFNTVMGASTSILEQFGLKSDSTSAMLKNTQRVTDSLTFVANKTAAGFSDMGEAMEYIGPVAHSLGMSVEETSAAVGLLSNNGIEGEKAGTSLRGALSRLLKPTKQSSAAFQELGINLDEWKKGNIGLPDMLDTIKKSTQGMTDAEKSSLIAKAFGVEAQTGMNILISQGGDALRNLTKETKNATGYTKGLADEMNKSDKNAFARAKATLETLSISLGQKLLPNIIPVLQKVDDLADSFDKLSPEAKNTIINMGLIAAAAYPASKALELVTGKGKGVVDLLFNLGKKGAGALALKGIETGAIEASGAIGAGGVGLSGSLSGLSPILAGIGPAGIAALGTAGLAGLILSISKVVDAAKERMKYFGTIEVSKETVAKVENFKGKIDDLSIAAEGFGTKGSKAFKDVSKAINDLSNTTKGDIDSATKKMQDEAKNLGFGDDVINNIKTGGDKAKEIVKQATDNMTSIYKKASDEHRNLTLIEQAQVATNQQKIAEQEISALGVTGSKKKQLMEALTGDINNISKKQAQDYSSSIQSILDKSDETFYQKQKQLKDLLGQGQITNEQYTAKEKELQNEHESTTQAYLGTLENMIMKQGEGLVQGTDQYKQWYTTSSIILGKYGVNLIDLVGKNGKAIDAITATSESLKAWNSIPTPVKKLLGDNANFKNNEAEASQILAAWNKASVPAKELLAKNLTKNPTMSAQAIIDTLTGKTVSLAANNNTESGVGGARSTINSLQGRTVPLGANNNTGFGVNSAAATIASLQGKTVGLDANDESARRTFNAFMNLPASKTISIIANTSKNATGTNYFEGGLATVNDQKGSLYKELITLPTGHSFIPEGRDVTMPLPRGTKILKASKTARMFPEIPKFAQGIGSIPTNARFLQDVRSVNEKLEVSFPQNNVGVNSSQLSIIISLLQELVSKEPLVLKEGTRNNMPTLREKNHALNQLQQELGYLFSNN